LHTSRRSISALRVHLLIPVAILASAWPAHAVHFTNSQVGPPTWKYDITFDPEDNYNIFQSPTTITMTGLSGVTAAAGPVSTDFSGILNTINLAWTAQVLNGGTTVVWTNAGGGTGNFGIPKHIFGFSITATGANGTVNFATSGFSRDIGNALPGGGFNLDISGTIAGPSAGGGGPTGVPATSSVSFALIILGLGGVVAYQTRMQMQEWFQNR
jgi:hypothetical protein